MFPVFLTEHQICWNEWYAGEKVFLEKVISQAERINHIGSTAISSIWAKPIIDILVEFPESYTGAKTELIQKYTAKAKAVYGKRYK